MIKRCLYESLERYVFDVFVRPQQEVVQLVFEGVDIRRIYYFSREPMWIMKLLQ